MSGYICFWSADYIKKLEKAGDTGPILVVYGSQHTKMPSISSLKIGDVVFPVALKNKTLNIMARLPIGLIEPAYDYIMRETGLRYSALIPKGILIRSKGPHGEFNTFAGGSGYTDKVVIPDHIHTIIQEESLIMLPHKFHQEPITCCAELAASGNNGSDIRPRPVPTELIPQMLFGKTKSSQKPLRLDKDGYPTTVSLSGFVRKMSDETFALFESIFKNYEN